MTGVIKFMNMIMREMCIANHEWYPMVYPRQEIKLIGDNQMVGKAKGFRGDRVQRGDQAGNGYA